MAKIWHFVNDRGEDVIQEWIRHHVQQREMGKLQSKVDSLQSQGSGLIPHLLTETGEPHIKKLRVKGSVQLRPLLCKLTDDAAPEEEFVLLVGAKEVQSRYVPADALKLARTRRLELLQNENQKTPHVRFARLKR